MKKKAMITIIFFFLITTFVYNFIIGSFLEVGKKRKFKKKIVWRGYKLLKIPRIYFWIRRYVGIGGAGERENNRRIRTNQRLAKWKKILRIRNRVAEKNYEEKARRERWWRWLLWGR